MLTKFDWLRHSRTGSELLTTLKYFAAKPNTEMIMFHCHICGSNEAREEFVEEVFKLNGKHVLVESIPAKVCASCGVKTFSRETTERIRRIVHDHSEPAKSVQVDVFEYA